MLFSPEKATHEMVRFSLNLNADTGNLKEQPKINCEKGTIKFE